MLKGASGGYLGFKEGEGNSLSSRSHCSDKNLLTLNHLDLGYWNRC